MNLLLSVRLKYYYLKDGNILINWDFHTTSGELNQGLFPLLEFNLSSWQNTLFSPNFFKETRIHTSAIFVSYLSSTYNSRLWPSVLGAGPSPIYFFTALSPIYFFAAAMYRNYFFTGYQNYYFTALLVENMSFISVLSKFQNFQLKEDKICN